MSKTSPGSFSPRRKIGVLALLLAVVLNALLPLASVSPALAADETGGAEAALLSNNPLICTAQGIQPLNPGSIPAPAAAFDGHCVFCFAGLSFAVLPAIATADIQPRSVRGTASGAHDDQVFLAPAHDTLSNPRAPPLSL